MPELPSSQRRTKGSESARTSKSADKLKKSGPTYHIKRTKKVGDGLSDVGKGLSDNAEDE